MRKTSPSVALDLAATALRPSLVLLLAGTLLSGCAHFQEVEAGVKSRVLLPANEIVAPDGPLRMYYLQDASPEQNLVNATEKGVKALLQTLVHPLSLTAPVSVQTLTSKNPHIISSNRFGSLVASLVSDTLVKEGHTVGGAPASEALLKNRTVITGTYTQANGKLTIALELSEVNSKEVLGRHEYVLPIDGRLRQLLDK